MRGLLICILLLLYFLNGYSQNNFATGKVIDSATNVSIKNAIIKVYNQDKIIGNFLTDSSGTFKISMLLFTSSTHLTIEAIDYHILFRKNINKTNPLNQDVLIRPFKMRSSIIHLKEVLVKNNRRKYRDTVNIDLTRDHFERDFMIEDFLSGEKGFSKGSNGKLLFRGKEVSDIVLNDGNFFGKNNQDIYRYLPALTLNNIEITETDIDSLTNTVMLRPMIKVNLKLKEKFKKGKFGSVNLGYGTINRYLFSTDLYKYKNNEQISIVINSNNINSGDNPFMEPNVSFSANGNDTKNESAKLGYRNLYYNGKIELDVSVKPKFESRKFDSEILRMENNIDRFSRNFNSSSSKIFSLEASNLNINYRIDSLNSVRAKQEINYGNTNQNDSLGYEISSNGTNTQSRIFKNRESSKFRSLSELQYLKRFASNRGRIITMNFHLDFNRYDFKENNNVLTSNNQSPSEYFISGNRNVLQRNLFLDFDFTEPIGDSGYLKFFSSYKDEDLTQNSSSLSDSLPSYQQYPINLYNKYLVPGIKYQKTFAKFSFDARIAGIINFRKIENLNTENRTLFNTDVNINLDFKINKKSNLQAHYLTKINYPNISQLTAVNNSFDLISQSAGNLYLKPEIGKRLELSYEFRKTDSIAFSFNGAAEFYNSKFGLNIENTPSSYQTSFIDNIGRSKAYEVGFSINKLFKTGKSINYHIGAEFEEVPSIIDNKAILNHSITFNQVLTSNFNLIKNMSVSPLVSLGFSQYTYDINQFRIYTITYSDKFSITIPKIAIINLSPLINYNYNLNSNATWALNGEIKHNFLKKYGAIWLKVYDIFNSFSYVNNYLGASYTQSSKYTNLNRYLLIGLNIKFNNMK